MKYSIAASGLLAAGALAHPLTTRQSTNIDPTILQFALTLEHLENVFYHNALQNFTQQDFEAAGYSATYYNNLKYISFDEQSHVQLLSSALTAAGVTPVQACQYKFPYTDVRSFITLSSVLEGVGTSAYLAGAPLITNKSYLTVAGSILVAEALHTSMQRGAIGQVPMANPYGTPLDPMAVYTLAAMFITSCPSTNPALPFTSFPTLSYAPNPACTYEGPDDASSKSKRDEVANWGEWNGGLSSTTSAKPAMETSKSTTKSEIKYASTTEAHKMATTTKSAYESHATESATEGWENWATETEGHKYETATVTKSGAYVTETATVTKTGAMATATKDCPKKKGFMGENNGDKYNLCAPPSAGATIVLTAANAIPAGSYVTFVSGLAVVSVKGVISGNSVSVVVPAVAQGQTYAFVTNADVEGTFSDAAVLFGPAVVEVKPAAPVIDYSIN